MPEKSIYRRSLATYRMKLERVMERLGVSDYDFSHGRREAWIEFHYKTQHYRFAQSVDAAQARGIELCGTGDCFAQLVLALEDLARLANRGLYDLQTWIVGLKSLPAHIDLPQCLQWLGFKVMPDAEAIRARYRELAGQLHPDAGGSLGDFQKLAQAYGQALAFVGERGPQA